MCSAEAGQVLESHLSRRMQQRPFEIACPALSSLCPELSYVKNDRCAWSPGWAAQGVAFQHSGNRWKPWDPQDNDLEPNTQALGRPRVALAPKNGTSLPGGQGPACFPKHSVFADGHHASRACAVHSAYVDQLIILSGSGLPAWVPRQAQRREPTCLRSHSDHSTPI